MCISCNANWCLPNCTCYGCNLRDKNIAISGETVAGYSYGRKPLILTDRSVDQRLDAGARWQEISTTMQKGGAVAEDSLQQACEQQLDRIKSAMKSDGMESPVKEWHKLEQSAQTGNAIE